MISYYELLGMIKEGKAPNEIKVYLNSQPKIYVREDGLDDTFSYYGLEEEEKEDSDYHYYLAEDFLESSMFDKTIEILDKKEVPEKLEYIVSDEDGDFTIDGYAMDCEQKIRIASKINEIIDYLNSKGE